MDILYITSMNLNKKGADKTHLTEIINSWEKMGNHVILYAPKYFRNEKIDFQFELRTINLFGKNYISYLLFHLIVIFKFPFLLKKYKPKMVYTRGLLNSFFLTIFTKTLKIPYLIEVNGIIEDELKTRNINNFVIKIISFILKFDYKSADMLICVTEGIVERLRELYLVSLDKCVVVENGVNLEKFYPLNKEDCRISCYKELKDSFIFGFVGSFAPWQGLSTIIEAVKILEDRGVLTERIKIVLVGDGEEFESLIFNIKKYSLENYFIFVGRIDYESVCNYINTFDVALATFTAERNSLIGLSPLKLYEYFACSIPVLSSNIPNLKKIIINNNCGFIFEADNATSLASEMYHCINLNKIMLDKMGENANELVKKHFSWDISAEKLLQVANR